MENSSLCLKEFLRVAGHTDSQVNLLRDGAIIVSTLTGKLMGNLLAGLQRPIVHYEGVSYTGERMRADIAHVQAVLREMRVGRGERIMLAEVNSYAFIATYTALLLYGAVAVPVNPEMPRPELYKVLARAEVAGAFIAEDLLGHFQLDQKETPPTCVRFVATLPAQDSSSLQLAVWSRLQNQWHSVSVSQQQELDCMEALKDGSSALCEEDGAILLYTSGTTGTPKGVLLTHRQVMATARNVALSHALTDRDVCYCFLPLFHINAQVIGLLTTLTTGGQLVLDRKFSASRFWPTVARQRVTWVSAVPTVIAILIKSSGQPIGDHRPRFVRSASAPLPDLHARRFEARFGVALIESYGMTEAASQICVNPLPPAMHKFGSAGRPFGIDLRVVDERGETVSQHEVGEIVIRGDSVITAYESGDTSGNSFRDGWFYTGDLGYRDADGFLFITGRSKEMINRAGQKISPREVEEVVLKHEAVKSAAVIGLPDDLYGERVVAYVIATSPRKKNDLQFKEQLRDLCLASISAYKCPAEFHIVDEIPLGPTGKIQRHRLREQAMSLGHAGAGI